MGQNGEKQNIGANLHAGPAGICDRLCPTLDRRIYVFFSTALFRGNRLFCRAKQKPDQKGAEQMDQIYCRSDQRTLKYCNNRYTNKS